MLFSASCWPPGVAGRCAAPDSKLNHCNESAANTFLPQSPRAPNQGRKQRDGTLFFIYLSPDLSIQTRLFIYGMIYTGCWFVWLSDWSTKSFTNKTISSKMWFHLIFVIEPCHVHVRYLFFIIILFYFTYFFIQMYILARINSATCSTENGTCHLY